MATELATKLINAGVHFGHGVSRWNPKMAPYIFTKRGKIHIINVKKTLAGMLIAKKLLAEIVSSGKDVVFVGTKRQAQKAVEAAAEKCGMHYVSSRWLGGTLTNFRTIRSRLQRLEQLEAMETKGTLEDESKKQASRLKREMRKMKSNLEGIRKMSRLPGAVVIVDAGKEYLALAEAKKLDIATIGIIDTDANPDMVDVVIPANDDSIRTITLILNELADAVAIGKTMVSAKQEMQPQRPRRARPGRAIGHADEEQSMSSGRARPVRRMGHDASVPAPAEEPQAESQTPASDENKSDQEQATQS